MSSSQLNCNPIRYTAACGTTPGLLMPETQASSPRPLSPLPLLPSLSHHPRAFAFVHFVCFSLSPPPSPRVMLSCSASSNMHYSVCSWFSEQYLISLPLGLSAYFTTLLPRVNPQPQLFPPGSLLQVGFKLLLWAPIALVLRPKTLCCNCLPIWPVGLRFSKAEKELAHPSHSALSTKSQAINVC